MRTLIAFLSFFVIISCTSEDISDELTLKEELSNQNLDKKVDICHKNAGVISISQNALQAHLAHGDTSAYSPLGSYLIVYFIGGFEHRILIDSFDGTNFTGQGNYIGGTGSNPNDVPCFVRGVVEDDQFIGDFSYDSEFAGRIYDFNGSLSGCDGVSEMTGSWTLIEE